MASVLGLTQSAFDPASRVRFIQYIPHLRRAGWSVEHRPNRPDRQWASKLAFRPVRSLHYRIGRVLMKGNRLRDILDARRFDVVFLNRDLAGRGHLLASYLLRLNPRVVFDFDDAIFLGENEPSIRFLCTHSAWVTAGNSFLAGYAHRFTDKVTVVPTVIDTEAYKYRTSPSSGDAVPLRVGWSGSDQSIKETLFPYLPMLRDLQRETPFELVIVSNTLPQIPEAGLRWVFRQWSPEIEGKIAEFMDIGVMPLLDNEFQKGKCGLKLLQYMAAGLPTVASPVGVNRQIVNDGISGFLAESPSEWHSALRRLFIDPQLRRSFGMEGRAICERDYSITKWLPVLVELFSGLAEVGRRGTKS